MNNIPQWSCEKFVDETFSVAPVPGGGGVSALTAALGIALAGMVCNLTINNSRYEEYRNELLEMLEKAADFKDRLMVEIDRDAENFLPLSECYKMPVSTEEEKNAKRIAMENALKLAIESPIEVIKLASDAMILFTDLLDKGAVMAISDVGCGVICLKSAVECAWLNVLINLKYMDDKQYASVVKDTVEPMVLGSCHAADRIYMSVTEKLG